MMLSRWARRQVGTTNASSGRMLLFSSAGLPLGVPLEDLSRVVEEDSVLPLPASHACLWGVMPTLEGASPIYDLAPLVRPGAPLVAGPNRLVALLTHPAGTVGIRVERLAGLAPDVTPLEARMQEKLQSALPPLVQGWITGAATARGQLFFFFSRDAFLGWLAAEGVAAPR